MSIEALNTFLEPVKSYLNDERVHEISINKPGEVWFTKNGELFCDSVESLDYDHLLQLAELTATACHQELTAEHPLLSATLPGGYRIQIIIPPACLPNHVVISIRRQTLLNINIDDYAKFGAFDFISTKQTLNDKDNSLTTLYDDNNFTQFIKQAVIDKKNILISGGTDTGKTTFLNACLAEIPSNERIITIEDSAEVQPPHLNRVSLLYSRGDQGVSTATAQELLEASLRLRPDRIILGELRGSEAYSFLRAINTGHEGSMTSLHADTPKLALDQIALMVLQAGLGISRDEVKEYVNSIIDIVVQLKRNVSGQRYISEIYYEH